MRETPDVVVMRLAGAMAGVSGRDFYLEATNRRKRSLAIDVRKPGGKEAIYNWWKNPKSLFRITARA